MTERSSERPSLYEERASTVAGTLGLAAAIAAANVARLFRLAKDASGMTSKEIASKLSITEGRVSQILNGDGNVHIATAARFLRAMGYELTVSAIPVEEGRRPLNLMGRRSRRTKVKETEKAFEVYVQTFLTHEGPMRVPMLLPAHDALRATPHGGPAQVGRIRVSAKGHVRRVPMRQSAWQADEVEVHRVGA